MLLLGACRGGGPAGFVPASTTSTTPVITTPPASTTITTVPPATVPAGDPAGSLALRVSGITLPDRRSGGSGLRLLVRAATTQLTVRRRGGGGSVSVCPIAGPTAVVSTGGCVDLAANGAVTVASVGGRSVGGVELRATGADAAVEEVGVTYLPASRATTIVTPARPAGACASQACEATFSLVPGGAGAFVMDARGTGGRPRMVLTSVAPTGAAASNRTLATVEGGAALSIRGTVEAGSEARLLHHEADAGAVFPVTAEILWP